MPLPRASAAGTSAAGSITAGAVSDTGSGSGGGGSGDAPVKLVVFPGARPRGGGGDSGCAACATRGQHCAELVSEMHRAVTSAYTFTMPGTGS